MLNLFTKLVCFIMITITSLYFIKTITNSKIKLLNVKNLILIISLVFIPFIIYKIQYTIDYTIIVYCLNIIVYREIFKLSIDDSIVACSIMIIILFLGDFIVSLIFMNFFRVEDIRNIWYLYLITNICVLLFVIFLIKIRFTSKIIQHIYKNIRFKKSITYVIYFLIAIILICILTYNISINFKWNKSTIINVATILSFFLLIFIYIKDKNKYSKLTHEYDNLFNYMQNFEEWIEKEQLNRHEYKNQLAVLRCMTKEKKIKAKIDEILEDSINVEGEVANQLKALPKGGIKGLMYYKASIAQKKNINLDVDICIERHSALENLSEKQLRDLCKLIGIYFDNAIEAAEETNKRNVTIEIYELKNKVNIVISNSFKQHKELKNRNQKGVSTKGEGHGNGLYFASKIINKNEWLEQKQDIIDRYYIQELIILKKEN